MSEAARGAAATTAEMRRGRRRILRGGGGGEPVCRGILSFVATMHTFALAASSLFGAAGKTTLIAIKLPMWQAENQPMKYLRILSKVRAGGKYLVVQKRFGTFFSADRKDF